MAGPGRHRHGTALASSLPLHHRNLPWIRITWLTSIVKLLKSTARSRLCLVTTESPQVHQHNHGTTTKVNHHPALIMVRPHPALIVLGNPPERDPNGGTTLSRMELKETMSTPPGTKLIHTAGTLRHSISFPVAFVKASMTMTMHGIFF